MPVIVVQILTLLIQSAPTIIQAGIDLKPFALALYEHFQGTPPTDADRIAIEAEVDALAARLQEPLDPPQVGDPDYKG